MAGDRPGRGTWARGITDRLRRMFELQDPRHARLLPMEGLRGFAVTLVFLQHYGVQADLIGLRPGPAALTAAAFRTYGNQGVELFFVLSGYLIYGTLVGRAPPFTRFMRRRVRRIYPTFLVVFAPALALGLLSPMPGKIPGEPWRAGVYLAANLALLPGLLPVPALVDVAWSLSYEMFFYLATAALVLGTGYCRFAARSRRAILLTLTAGFVAVAWAELPYFPVRMMPFFAGMLLAEGMGRAVPPWLGVAAAVAACAAAVRHTLPGAVGELGQSVTYFALCAVCLRGAGGVSQLMAWTPLRWLGNMSYSYYLAHGYVVRIGMIGLARALPAGMPDWVFWAFMPALYAASVAVASVLFVCIEKPVSLRPAPAARPAVPA